jgi:hypothetical protein
VWIRPPLDYVLASCLSPSDHVKLYALHCTHGVAQTCLKSCAGCTSRRPDILLNLNKYILRYQKNHSDPTWLPTDQPRTQHILTSLDATSKFPVSVSSNAVFPQCAMPLWLVSFILIFIVMTMRLYALLSRTPLDKKPKFSGTTHNHIGEGHGVIIVGGAEV